MGKTSHAASGAFSADLNAYLKYVVNANGREDLSGRWVEEITNKARSRDYWAKLIKNDRGMTMNDAAVLAAAFGMPSAYDFVAAAKQLADGGTPPAPHVGPHAEDYEISEDPSTKFALAAKRRPKPGV